MNVFSIEGDEFVWRCGEIEIRSRSLSELREAVDALENINPPPPPSRGVLAALAPPVALEEEGV